MLGKPRSRQRSIERDGHHRGGVDRCPEGDQVVRVGDDGHGLHVTDAARLEGLGDQTTLDDDRADRKPSCPAHEASVARPQPA